jgi:hypothetical protein
MPPEPEERNELLYDKVMSLQKDFKEVLGTVKDCVGNLAVCEKDILNLREVQRMLVNDVDSLKASEKSKFRAILPADGFNNELSSQRGGFGPSGDNLTKVKL